ncbi:MAG: DUF4258 domain-containing protein [Candidatus Diapherotrites archaeon]|nr:DUF4258 domain-containing protein [Candidatus Diapherotrites archaeon]
MEVIFTRHALARLESRGIVQEMVLDAVRFPTVTLKKYGKYYFLKETQNGTIEVVCEKTTDCLKVITVYWV